MNERAKKQTIVNIRYCQEEDHYKDFARGGRREEHAKTWLEQDTVDSWLHDRMYSLLDPILLTFPAASWLTIGDGRYGKDANYIRSMGSKVMASDISDLLLKEAKEMGYIDDYCRQNAEALTFEDDAFDFVLCKESYHHFPRPMIALYEMLRVAQRGVILIEPVDRYVYSTFVEALMGNLKKRIWRILRRPNSTYGYEEIGNYIYTLSKRDIEKVALGMNYEVIAFKGINSHYIEGVEYQKAVSDNVLFKKIKRKILFQDIVTKVKLRQYSISSFVIVKDDPGLKFSSSLASNGYDVIALPRNPYMTR